MSESLVIEEYVPWYSKLRRLTQEDLDTMDVYKEGSVMYSEALAHLAVSSTSVEYPILLVNWSVFGPTTPPEVWGLWSTEDLGNPMFPVRREEEK